VTSILLAAVGSTLCLAGVVTTSLRTVVFGLLGLGLATAAYAAEDAVERYRHGQADA
jgi:uncharacterized membrane protein